MLTILILWALPACIIAYLYQSYTFLPRSIPGPLLAKFSNVHRLLSVYRRNPHNDQLNLHKQRRPASDIVRIGPSTVSVSGPNYIAQIYSIDKKLPKSDFYATFQNIVNGRRAASLVAVTDESAHSAMKRLVANTYALSTLVEFEPLVDETTRFFLEQLEARFGSTTSPNEFDLGAWLQYYAFDVMGELTFSRRLGFLDEGRDVKGIMSSISRNFEYFSVIGQMPWLDEWLGKNPLYVKYLRRPVSSPILKFAQQLLAERLKQVGEGREMGKDFLARFLAAREKVVGDVEKTEDGAQAEMTDGLLLSLLFGNINAGSDTIATTLRATFWYLFTNSKVMDKLKQELEQAHSQGKLTLPVPTWHETQSEECLYLRCVIKEAVRLWPALALVLERRVVDPAGLKLESVSGATIVLPKGTVVGINPYVLHRDERIFDPNFDKSTTNVEEFDPARWMPGDQNSRGNTQAQLKTMDHDVLTFSAGKRTCLGKNIAMMEMCKIVPALVMKFPNMEMVDTKRWKVQNAWVLAQTGLDVKMS